MATRTFALTNPGRAGLLAAAFAVGGAIALVTTLIALLEPGDRAPLFLPLGITAFAVIFVPLFLLLRRVALSVHADGLVVREGLGRRAFVPYDAVASVTAAGPSVVLERLGGRVERYDVTPDGLALTARALEDARRERARSIASTIGDAFRAHRAAPEIGRTVPLERGDRTATEWLRALRRIGDGGVPTFRDSPTPTRDELLAIATSSRAAPTHRVAAGVALRSALTDAEKPRIRVAAESSGAPRLAERLGRVLDASSDEELAALLLEVERRE